jgi:NAD+ synthase
MRTDKPKAARSRPDPLLTVNPAFVAKILANFIREELSKFGFQKGILGLSGGVDSSVCAYLAAKALGRKNVLALIMPYRESPKQDEEDAREVAGLLRIRSKVIDISPMINAYFARFPVSQRLLMGNKMARERMSILYDFSAREKSLILGTSNKTEILIGYGTIHGDLASAINPLGDLYKTQIRQLGKYLGVPERIVRKVPTAGLWPGQTDEGEIGLSYKELDAILFRLVDLRMSRRDVVASGFEEAKVERIISLIKASEFKRKLPPIAKLSTRTVGHDFLYPYDWDK